MIFTTSFTPNTYNIILKASDEHIAVYRNKQVVTQNPILFNSNTNVINTSAISDNGSLFN